MFHVGVTESQDCRGERAIERRYEQDGRRSLTTKLVDAIAEFKDIDPMKPGFSLYDSVDTDALEDFFASASGTELRTEFSAVDVMVCVSQTMDGETVITVWNPDE